MPRTQTTTLLLSLATLCVPAFAQGTYPAVRDSYSYSSSALNYVQGQVTLDGQPVSTNPNTAPRPLHTGDSLATTNGTADVMLAPGSLLRLGQGTDVQMVANDAGRHEVRLDSGRANVAVNAVPEHSLLLIDLPNGQTQILKRGLYTFDTATDTMRVFNGEADAFPGAETDTGVKPLKVKDGHELTFNEGRAKPASFDREMDTDLLPWSGAGEARAVVADGAVNQNAGYASAGYGYGAAGFYGDGYGYGYPLYAGFGYPYGSYGYPYGFYGSPFGLGLGFGYYGGGFYGRGFGGYGGGFSGGGFHGGGFGGGGFHGGGGFGGGRR